MRAPTQCALWKTPLLIKGAKLELFELIENFGDEGHWSRDLLKCRECGQLYVHDFCEEINWSGGEDSQFATYVPVATNEEIEALKSVSVREILQLFPHLSVDLNAGSVFWIER